MPDGVTNFEVISLVRRRRRWSPEQKLALVQEMGERRISTLRGRRAPLCQTQLAVRLAAQMREGTMRGVARAEAVFPIGASAPGYASVRIADASSSLPPAQWAISSVAKSGGTCTAIPILELMLPNGRVLRFAETMAPEIRRRFTTALEA